MLALLLKFIFAGVGSGERQEMKSTWRLSEKVHGVMARARKWG